MTTTRSPWADLIPHDDLPHLPESLELPSAALRAIVAACSEVAARNAFDYLGCAETAEVLAASVPDLTPAAAAVLLGTLAESLELEPLNYPEDLLEVIRDESWPDAFDVDKEDVATVAGAMREAFDALEPCTFPVLPDDAIDPRAIPATLSPRPATAHDVIALTAWTAFTFPERPNPEIGWPLVVVQGEALPVPGLEALEALRHYSALTHDPVEPGHPDSWEVLLELPPLDAQALARRAEAEAAKDASRSDRMRAEEAAYDVDRLAREINRANAAATVAAMLARARLTRP